MKRRLAWVGVLMALLTSPAMAWRPAGWVYFNGPYAYEHATGQWHWFTSNAPQWANGFPPADGWKPLNQSGLAHGWSWHTWPYAFSHARQAWYYFSANGRQRTVNLGTGAWSVFGVSSATAGMVLIPGGTNAGTDPDFGAYSLTVASFYMDAHEITKAKWDQVYTWALAHGYDFENAGIGQAANHPVLALHRYDCVKWCNARSQMAGLEPFYYADAGFTQVYKSGRPSLGHVKTTADGYRLPTDAEWQYAARGGMRGQRFPWGLMIAHIQANYSSDDTQVWDNSATPGGHPAAFATWPNTMAVGMFSANGYGLHDMAGNAEEWCFDWNPGPWGGNGVLHGGNFASSGDHCRVARRTEVTDYFYAWDTMGFRTVLPADR